MGGNKRTYRENLNSLEGIRRIDDPNRWCYAKMGLSGRHCFNLTRVLKCLMER